MAVMKIRQLIVFCLIVCTAATVHAEETYSSPPSSHVPGLPVRELCQPGDILLGALADYSNQRDGLDGTRCGDGPSGFDVNVRTIFYHIIPWLVDKINRDPDILPNVTLGYVILDTCITPRIAVARSLDFLPISRTASNESRSEACNRTRGNLDYFHVMGVAGASWSSTSLPAAEMLGLFQIPMISPWATNDALSNKAKYPYFLRTVPPNKYQAKALVILAQKFGWSKISIVFEDDEYGRGMYNDVEQVAENQSIYLASQLPAKFSFTNEEYDKVAKDLVLHNDTRVVLLFIYPATGQGLFSSVRRLGYPKHFIWLSGDTFGFSLQSYRGIEDVAEGMMALQVDNRNNQEFIQWFQNLTLENEMENYFFREFWKHHFNCQFTSDDTQASNLTLCLDIKEQQVKDGGLIGSMNEASQMIDVLYTYVYALHSYIHDHCQGVPPDLLKYRVERRDFFHYLKNSDFNGAAGRVKFNEDGDMMGRYKFVNYQPSNVSGPGKLVKFATWDIMTQEFVFLKNVQVHTNLSTISLQ